MKKYTVVVEVEVDPFEEYAGHEQAVAERVAKEMVSTVLMSGFSSMVGSAEIKEVKESNR